MRLSVSTKLAYGLTHVIGKHGWRFRSFASRLLLTIISSDWVALGEAETDLNGQMYLNLALSKELEDLDDYPLSFDHLVIGKRAGRHGRAYSTERDRRISKH